MFIFHPFKIAVIQKFIWWPHIFKSAMWTVIGLLYFVKISEAPNIWLLISLHYMLSVEYFHIEIWPWICIYIPQQPWTHLLTHALISFHPSLVARFMGLTWDPPEADGTKMGPMLAPWILLFGLFVKEAPECTKFWSTGKIAQVSRKLTSIESSAFMK